MSDKKTRQVEDCIHRLKEGDESARDELVAVAYEQLLRLTRKIGSRYPHVKRWEDTQDIANKAYIRLQRALTTVELNDAQHFYRLAALKIRQELIDLARHYYGEQGMGRHHATVERFSPESSAPPMLHYDQADDTHDPQRIADWAELHTCVEQLSQTSREIFDLLYYDDKSQQQAADLLGVSERTVRQRWRRAKIDLGRLLRGDPEDLSRDSTPRKKPD